MILLRSRLARPGWLVLLSWGLAIFSLPARGQTPEFRAAWADVFHAGMGSATEVNNMVNALASGHYNAVIVQVLAYMDNTPASHGAHWKSAILPWSSRVKANFDPLAYLCQQAHAQGIEVHAWLGGSGGSMYRVSNVWPPAGNAVLTAHPEWFGVPRANSEGGTVVGYQVNSTTYYTLDMGSPDVQEYLVSIVRELVTNYPIDGINWDDEIDGPVYTAGVAFPAVSTAVYPNSGLARYRRNTGYVGTPSATDAGYNEYRRRFKNELMARMQAEIQSIKSNPRQPLRHTSAALAYSPVPAGCDFTTSTPYLYYCDWAGMLQHGWVDAVVPQLYAMSTYYTWNDRIAACWQYNRHVFPGIGAYLNTDATIASAINYSRSKGLKGNSIYSYAVPTSASGSGSGWWSYVAANVYTNVVGTPPMPWRNPATATEGIVWGRVKDHLTGQYVDDAIVTVAGGPTVRTDGNGYYVATLVPATASGTPHLTTAGKTGMASQSTNAMAMAGDIVRYDFLLNAPGTTPAAPSSLTAAPVSSSQIHLTWTDNATNETGFVVARATTAGGPYNEVAGLTTNSVNYTDDGLLAETTYFYVVRATNASGASPNSTAASATTFAAPPAPPLIVTQPRDRTIFAGESAHFTVVAQGNPAPAAQWRLNGTNLPGANRSALTLSGVNPGQAGEYSVVLTNSSGAVTSAPALLTVHSPIQVGRWQTNWMLAPYARPYLTTNSLPGQRGLALNPATQHLLLVNRDPLQVPVLDAATGADLHLLNVSGISGGTYPLLMIGVADDGAVYAGNLTVGGATTDFKLYRWADDESGTLPTLAFSGDPGAGDNQRWGDTLAVRGAGTNTQILLGTRAANLAAVLTTTDGLNFTASKITVPDADSGGPFGLGIAFGAGSTFWGKATSQNLRQVAFNLTAGTGTTLRSHGPPEISTTLAPLGVHPALNVLGLINVGTTGNQFRLYDLASPTPALIATAGFASDNSNTGAGTGAVAFDYDRAYALGGNNGIIALQLLPAVIPPTITANPLSRSVKVGTNVTFTASASGTAPLAYQWRFNAANIAGATNNVLALTGLDWPNGGQYALVVTNLAGSVTSAPAWLTILPPDPAHIDSALWLPDGRLEFTASGDMGHYSVETSTNLFDWTELAVVPNTNGSFFWFDYVTNAPQQFFRVRHNGP
ncbi:MAG TPA: family 10 glycosylhydrolase [Verrucomicrobiota bacterium]|nr:family 10 glycosylhydrolase [Verrucomicrobiota bacterium]HNT13606.1 family 10 glycosylhydrolase [Verrucomicrobiota bacterium]